MNAPFTRRSALAAAAGFGLSVSFLGRAAYADAALAGRKLVVVVCRGAMDGLSVTPPVGDPDYAALRGAIAIAPPGAVGGALPLGGPFALHPKLTAIHALAAAGQARIAPAVATPDRARSHFEAQDVLESGGTRAYGAASGWLNRALQSLGPSKAQALSVGAQAPLILRGPVQAQSWAPGGLQGGLPRLPGILADLYANDPLLGPALASGLKTEAMARAVMAQVDGTRAAPPGMQMSATEPPATPALALARGGAAARSTGRTVAGFMTAAGGPSIVAISLDGFDTHANQGAAEGQLAVRLAYLDALADGLVKGLGPAWRDTAVLVVTEFGRTAHVNGTGGTDHGTASTALLLGGGLKRGGILGDWPSLKASALFEGRDTAPTLDMRALFKGVLAEQFGLDRRTLDTTIFPDSRSAAPIAGLIA